MGLQDPFCCLSNRTGTLILLYYFLIDNVWSLLIILTNLDDSKYWKIIEEHFHIACVGVLILLIGSTVVFSAILYVSYNKPSVSLLSTAIVILLMGMIHSLFYIGVEQKIREIRVNQDSRIRNPMKNPYAYNHIRSVFMFPTLLPKFYTVFVFLRYILEVKKNRTNNASFARTIFYHEEDGDAPSPPPYPVQPTAPPLSPKPFLDPKKSPIHSNQATQYSPPPPPYPGFIFQHSVEPPPYPIESEFNGYFFPETK